MTHTETEATLSGTGRPTLATLMARAQARPAADSLAQAPALIDAVTDRLGMAPGELEADVRVLHAAARAAGAAGTAAPVIDAIGPHIKRARARSLLPRTPQPTGPWAEVAETARQMNDRALSALVPVLAWCGHAPEDVDDDRLEDAILRQLTWRFVGADPDPVKRARDRHIYRRRIKQAWNGLAEVLPLAAVPVPSTAPAGPAVSPAFDADLAAYLAHAARTGALGASTRRQRRDVLRRSAARVRAQGHGDPQGLADLLTVAGVTAALNGAIAACEQKPGRPAPADGRSAMTAGAEVRTVAKALKHVHRTYAAAPAAAGRRLDTALKTTATSTHTLPDATRERLRDHQTPQGLADLRALPRRIARTAGYARGRGVPAARVAMALALTQALGAPPIELARLRRADINLGPIGGPSTVAQPVRAHARTDAIQAVRVGPRVTLILHRYLRRTGKLAAPADTPVLTNPDPDTARDTLLTQLCAVLPAHTDRPLTAQDIRDLMVLLAAQADTVEAGADAVGASDPRSLARRLAPLLAENAHPRTRAPEEDRSC